jgi:hypothetical protein
VLIAVMTWLITGFAAAPDAIVTAGFDAVLILTLPLGYVGYGFLAYAGLALSGDGVVASVILAVLSVVVFIGAAIVNVITVRGLWRWSSRRRGRPSTSQASASP